MNLSRFPGDCPVIITGDFNANPGSRPHTVFRKNGFYDIFDHQHSTTFHKFRGEKTLDHIDWILYRGHITPVKKKIITDSFSGRYPSDHYPVMAAFGQTDTAP